MMEAYKGLPLEEAVRKYQKDHRRMGIANIFTGSLIVLSYVLAFIFGSKPEYVPNFALYPLHSVQVVLGSGLIVWGIYERFMLRDVQRAKKLFLSDNDERLTDAFWKSGFIVIYILSLVEILFAITSMGLCENIAWWPGVMVGITFIAIFQILVSISIYLVLRSGKI